MMLVLAHVLVMQSHSFVPIKASSPSKSLYMASTENQVKADYNENVMNTYGRYPLTIRLGFELVVTVSVHAIHIHTHIHTYIHTYVRTYIHTHIH